MFFKCHEFRSTMWEKKLFVVQYKRKHPSVYSMWLQQKTDPWFRAWRIFVCIKSVFHKLLCFTAWQVENLALMISADFRNCQRSVELIYTFKTEVTLLFIDQILMAFQLKNFLFLIFYFWICDLILAQPTPGHTLSIDQVWEHIYYIYSNFHFHTLSPQND